VLARGALCMALAGALGALLGALVLLLLS